MQKHVTMHPFHQTRFSYHESWTMLSSFLCMYIGLSLVIYIIMEQKFMSHVDTLLEKDTGMATFLTMLVVEVLPILLVCYIIHRRAGYEDYHILYLIKKWLRRFLSDLWNNKLYLMGTLVAFYLVEMITSVITNDIFHHGAPVKSKNTEILGGLIKSNLIMLLIVDIFAPLAEELVFRFWLPKVLYGMLIRLVHGCASLLSRRQISSVSQMHSSVLFWICATVSAFCFAILHLQGQPLYMSAEYVVLALFLQVIACRTKSLTAPVLIHGGSNCLTMLLMLMSGQV